MNRILQLLLILLLCVTPAWAAWTHVNTEGAFEKVGDSVIVLNPSTNPATDSIVVVVCSTDNPDNTGPGEKTFHTITDDQGNSWTRLMEYQGAGNANATTITSVWASKLGATITGNITCTLGQDRSAKVLIMSEYTVAAGQTFSNAGANRTSGSGTSPSILLTGLPSAEYNWLGVLGTEGPSGDSFTEDGDYTQRNRTGTTGGGAAGNQTANSANRILTATADTYNPTQASRDFVIILVALEEVAEPTGNTQAIIIGGG
jgi:hypothetical protein